MFGYGGIDLHLKNKSFGVFIIIIVVVLYIMGVRCSATTTAFMTPVQEDNQKVIVVDPGHGGMDGGAKSKKGTIEKDINLAISLKLKDKLNSMGYSVIMTREEDKGLYTKGRTLNEKKLEDLNNRCKIKRESNCDAFISIHQNFFTESCYYGAQVWYSKNENSEKLAHIIQENFKRDLDRGNNRIEKPAGNSYKILRCYFSIPSVIVECGFLSNPQEEQKLIDEEYQGKVVDSLAKSIEEFFLNNEQVM